MNTKQPAQIPIPGHDEPLEYVKRNRIRNAARLHAPDLLAMLERVTDELRLIGNLSGMGNNPTVIESSTLIAQIKGE